jgi:hypothetical protein
MTKSSALLAAIVLLLATVPARAVEPSIVVELFTSEGCSSCPPADALLAELATRSDVLALSFHVDYWDRLGWKDPFSSAAATARQRRYAASLGLDTVYTPQIVVDGRWQAVGSDRGDVARALDAAHRTPLAVPVALAVDHGRARITIGSDVNGATGAIVLIGFDRQHIDTVERGENEGRILTHVDVVRGIAEIGRFDGKAGTIEAPIAWHADRLAAMIEAANGRILGAAITDTGPL